jgi:transcriptional regulator with XRE-family HTH domain
MIRDRYPSSDTKSMPISELDTCTPASENDELGVPPRKADKILAQQIGERIRKTRLARGIEQQELARLAGVKPHTMWRYEAGQMKPGVEKVDRMADALGVPSQWLTRGGMTPPGLNLDGPPPTERSDDQRIVHEQQLQLLDELDVAPNVRSAWTLHAQGRGAYQRITRVYLSRFLEVASQELSRGSSVRDAEELAGDYALNYALEAHAAKQKKHKRKR